jgi:hypothetical protein
MPIAADTIANVAPFLFWGFAAVAVIRRLSRVAWGA